MALSSSGVRWPLGAAPGGLAPCREALLEECLHTPSKPWGSQLRSGEFSSRSGESQPGPWGPGSRHTRGHIWRIRSDTLPESRKSQLRSGKSQLRSCKSSLPPFASNGFPMGSHGIPGWGHWDPTGPDTGVAIGVPLALEGCPWVGLLVPGRKCRKPTGKFSSPTLLGARNHRKRCFP